MSLSAEMRDLIAKYPLGMVASINDDGTPNLSPKGTMIVRDERSVLFGDIRSPHTIHNIKHRPTVEVTYLDVLSRRSVKLRANARVIAKSDDEYATVRPLFDVWGALAARLRHIVWLDVQSASMISSPAYDIGVSEAELRQQYKARLASL